MADWGGGEGVRGRWCRSAGGLQEGGGSEWRWRRRGVEVGRSKRAGEAYSTSCCCCCKDNDPPSLRRWRADGRSRRGTRPVAPLDLKLFPPVLLLAWMAPLPGPAGGSSKPLAQSQPQPEQEEEITDLVAFQSSLDDSVSAVRSLVDSWLPKDLDASWDAPDTNSFANATLASRARPAR